MCISSFIKRFLSNFCYIDLGIGGIGWSAGGGGGRGRGKQNVAVSNAGRIIDAILSGRMRTGSVQLQGMQIDIPLLLCFPFSSFLKKWGYSSVHKLFILGLQQDTI
jgi:hypothetical protein